ncbi:hypothetical protein NDN01_17755 [Sphingomonas sp. QA11]|uniref:citrate/2-methylcitrate synthase n=1 Tax=Sphingomonas sp. QA11 TaxID=2950605 RepID=UPI00234939F5|nr:citrate/2-methylcitrate synthase [Sphingomonas sp. QA11]WCM25860.1 hypothetical protein NDN01_17755 [Sphingomonas sp. QA11]
MELDDKLYISAREAAAILGVSMATLYTYVSRGHLRVQRSPGQRESRYWLSDVERMKGRPSSRGGTGFATLVSDSAITLVTRTGTYYRGRDVTALAETHTLEQVATLLWDLEDVDVFDAPLPALPALNAGFSGEISALDFPDRVGALVPFMERANPRCFDATPNGFAEGGAGMLRWVVALMVGRDTISTDPIHLQVVSEVPVTERDGWAEVARRLLVLSADHDLDPTTLAARAVANTGVSPYRVMMAAMMTAEGRRGVQVRARGASRLLDEIDEAVDPTAPILGRLRSGEALPGFGAYIHVGGDSRVNAILSTYRRFLPDDPDIARFLRVVDMVRDATGLAPQFVLALWVFNRKLIRLHKDLSLLRIGRICGWIAHALEQSTHDVVRPRSLYLGRLPE